jgi:methylated-DNA-protein-cysteine methyltransferase-like protein
MTRSDFERVYHAVRLIPQGKVATYGQVALWLDWPHGARTVGWALRALQPGTDVPWHRVVNAKGRISLADERTQRARLEREGVRFDDTGRIDLAHYHWSGPSDPNWEKQATFHKTQ